MNKLFSFLVIVCVTGAAQAQALKPTYGKATYYGERFNHHRTSSGEIFNMDSMTAASKTLPFGTILKVTNLNNNKSVIVRVNDRCPSYNRNLIDLSKAAAISLDMTRAGSANVMLENIGDVPTPHNTLWASKAKSRPQRTAPAKKAQELPYAVQLGTFRVKSNADNLAANLHRKGFHNHRMSAKESMYKVSIGPYSSEAQASAALKKLKSNNFDGRIVKGNSFATL